MSLISKASIVVLALTVNFALAETPKTPKGGGPSGPVNPDAPGGASKPTPKGIDPTSPGGAAATVDTAMGSSVSSQHETKSAAHKQGKKIEQKAQKGKETTELAGKRSKDKGVPSTGR